MKHKNHEKLDLLCNFSHFRKYMRKFDHKIFFMILLLRASDLFCFRHGVLLLLLITPGQNRGKPNFPQFQGNISQEPLKLFYKFFFFYFTVRRLSENVKYCLGGSTTFVCNKSAQGGGLQKRNISYTTSVSLTIIGLGQLTQLA